MTTTAPRYPSTAELAAFRRTIRPSFPIPLSMTTWAPTSGPGQAWPHELREGIGYWSPAACDLIATTAARWSREAGAMRARAFGNMPDTAATAAAMLVYEPRAPWG